MVYLTLLAITVVCSFLLMPRHTILADKAYIKVHFFPAGEGEATVVECNDDPDDSKGNITLTLINAGSTSMKRDSMQIEYFKFLDNLMSNPKYKLKTIILTNPQPKYYNFITPFVKASGVEIDRIRFYIGGRRNSYALGNFFEKHDEIYEFSRENASNLKIGSCGHYAENRRDFYKCVKKGKYGALEGSDGIIQICEKFQVTVMAANYGVWLKQRKDGQLARRASSNKPIKPDVSNQSNNSTDDEWNHLILKITPTGKSSPSMLLGDFENDKIDIDSKGNYDYFALVKEAHEYHTESEKFPLSLSGGLASTVVCIPQNRIRADPELEEFFYSRLVQPTYAVVSSDITDSSGHPRCDVLEAVNNYLSMFSATAKTYECQPKYVKNAEDIDIHVVSSSSNLYQTSIVNLRNLPQAQVYYKLITFTMTPREIGKPTYEAAYKEEKYIPVQRVSYGE